MTVDEADSIRVVTLYEDDSKSGSILIYNDNYTDNVTGLEVIATTSTGIEIKHAPYDDIQAYCWTTKDGIHAKYTPAVTVHDSIVEIVENVVIVKREDSGNDSTSVQLDFNLSGSGAISAVTFYEGVGAISGEVVWDSTGETQIELKFPNEDVTRGFRFTKDDESDGSTVLGTTDSGYEIKYEDLSVINAHKYSWQQGEIFISISTQIPYTLDDIENTISNIEITDSIDLTENIELTIENGLADKVVLPYREVTQIANAEITNDTENVVEIDLTYVDGSKGTLMLHNISSGLPYEGETELGRSMEANIRVTCDAVADDGTRNYYWNFQETTVWAKLTCEAMSDDLALEVVEYFVVRQRIA